MSDMADTPSKKPGRPSQSDRIDKLEAELAELTAIVEQLAARIL